MGAFGPWKTTIAVRGSSASLRFGMTAIKSATFVLSRLPPVCRIFLSPRDRYHGDTLRPPMLLCDRYVQLRDSARAHERALFPPQRTPSELELQARWFAGDFGRRFQSVSGDNVEIVQFGTWNRAAGPDFSDVVVRLNSNEPIRGTIEFDLAD